MAVLRAICVSEQKGTEKRPVQAAVEGGEGVVELSCPFANCL